jgi:hypothetical protein
MSYTYGGQTMLKTVETSRATKTKGVAVTYRAGSGEKFATCPADCKMNCSGKGAAKLDDEYLDALLDAVPRKGVSFTYSHFDPNVFGWGKKLKEGKTVINFSTESPAAAAASIHNGVPSVCVVSPASWKGKKTQEAPFNIKVVRCPAEYRDKFSCRNCGNGLPLCARLDRNYIIGFTAHGASKKKAADPHVRGGCYASGGNVSLHWRDTANSSQPDETDGEKLRRFAKSLPPRSIIRHHVAGDIGRE